VLRWAAAGTAAGWKGCTKRRHVRNNAVILKARSLCRRISVFRKPRSQERGFLFALAAGRKIFSSSYSSNVPQHV
jgi:hypothetical protein